MQVLSQVAIAFLGVTAIFLSQSGNAKPRRFACLFGLAGQPFWFYSAVAAQQWGIVLLCAFYTVARARGGALNAARAIHEGRAQYEPEEG